ncbi:cardiolipin synthase, partial [Staphylococcus aureus]
VNAFVYDENLAKDLRAAYEHDITKSKQLTEESYANRPLSVKFKESLAKLVSPIL